MYDIQLELQEIIYKPVRKDHFHRKGARTAASINKLRRCAKQGEPFLNLQLVLQKLGGVFKYLNPGQ